MAKDHDTHLSLRNVTRRMNALARAAALQGAKLPGPARAVKGIGTQRAIDVLGWQIPCAPPIPEHPPGVAWPRLGGLPLFVDEQIPAGEVWLIDEDDNPIAKVTGLE